MARMIKPGMDGRQMRDIAKNPDQPMMKHKKASYDQNQPPVRPNMNYKKKMTQAQDDADDRRKGIKIGSAKDLAIDKSRGLKAKKKKTLSTQPAMARYNREDKDLDVKTKKKAAPMIKPSHRGLLHRELGVAQGNKIPSSKLNQALNSESPKIRKQANFARNFNK